MLGFFIGEVMKETNRTVQPQRIKAILQKLLDV